MALDESRSSPSLALDWVELKPAAGETLRAALERTLRDAIRAGALRAGVRLPASRVLARSLGISRGVVTDAYGQLEAQGFLVVRPRGAPIVAAVPEVTVSQRRAEERPPPVRYDLTPTTPDVTLFPLGRWLAAGQKAARRASVAVLGYRDHRGEGELRETLADHLGRTRGVIADPADIVVVQGAAQGVDLLLRVLHARGGRRVAVEDPSHATQHARIRAVGLDLVASPVDADGVVVAGLDADAVLVTPTHQFPLGSVLSGARRRELLAWAERTGGLIVEDDYDSEFRYDREPVRSLQGLAPDHVVQLGTVSKSLAPALRLGWLVVPGVLTDAVERTKRLVDDFSPSLEQLTLAELMRSGEYDRQIRRARAVYRRRRDQLLSALGEHLPESPVEGIAAGIHVLLRLEPGVDDSAVAAAAEQVGVRVSPLSAFRIRPAREGGLVVGYGCVHESAVDEAVRRLAGVIRGVNRARADARSAARRPRSA
jgi:GntR family transcriptional regulator/MocR family aminotransferase